MNLYKVKVSYLAPYPVEKNYEKTASGFNVAVSRALRQWRKELKGKKIKELNIKVIKL